MSCNSSPHKGLVSSALSVSDQSLLAVAIHGVALTLCFLLLLYIS